MPESEVTAAMPRWMDRLQHEAELRLAPEVGEYYRMGAGAQITAGEAVAAWSALRLRPHVLNDVTTVDSGARLLGNELRTPLLVASSTLQMQADPRGEAAMAAGAAGAGSLLTVSSNAGMRFADIGAEGAPWWVQAYVLPDRGLTAEMLQRAVAAGAAAAVVTVDTPVVGTRHFAGRSVWEIARRDELMSNWDVEGLGDTDVNAKAADLTPDDIHWLAEVTGAPVVVKGVLRGDDARRAVDAGAAGVIVSNHGGRQLDQSVSTASALPEVVDALAGTGASVTVDGGIRSGIHALCALALGADAVWVGRPAVWALAAHGSAGVTRLLDELTAELVEAMRICGCVDLASLARDLIAA